MPENRKDPNEPGRDALSTLATALHDEVAQIDKLLGTAGGLPELGHDEFGKLAKALGGMLRQAADAHRQLRDRAAS